MGRVETIVPRKYHDIISLDMHEEAWKFHRHYVDRYRDWEILHVTVRLFQLEVNDGLYHPDEHAIEMLLWKINELPVPEQFVDDIHAIHRWKNLKT